ncbi:MAG TPA: molybdopterin cofactor-binding domain-containing protein, partial [Beijerinckiaceae bacterium]|nr:molybdopterin cofactor-binding domain-containing protein [Beijerinckiaceae bacterium]
MTLLANRRDVLRSAGSLVVALNFAGPGSVLDAFAADTPKLPKLPGDLDKNRRLSGWLSIGADGKVTLRVGKVELGQGVLTAFEQICAEELDIDMARIAIISGDTALVPDEGGTTGSFSVANGGTAVQHASADARQILVGLAAQKLGVDPATLVVEDGTVKAPDGRQTTYWDIVTGHELDVDATAKAPVTAVDKRRTIGKPVQRIDIPDKVTGTRIFVQDLRPDGMLHGRVLRPPAYGASLVALDTSAVETAPGIVKVVRDGSFVGIVAEREEQAIAAVNVLRQKAQWNVPSDGPSSQTIYDWLVAQKVPAKVWQNKQSPIAANAVATVEAEYRRPNQMHGSIGPSTAVATFNDDGTVLVQTHTQTVFETAGSIAAMLGIDKKNVRCQHEQGSGCYGHNAMDDAAADAALLARAVPGRPVRIQWSRNDEHKWEPYGPAMLIKTHAALDAKGDIVDWTFDVWSTSHGTRPGNEAGNLLPAQFLEKPFALPLSKDSGPPNYSSARNAIALYDFPGERVTTHFIPYYAARVSAMRGLGAYANVFALESFIDELARRAKADPVEYRLRYLKDTRGRDVLTKAAEIFGWSNWQAAPGHGRGIAVARYKNHAAYTAVAMEVAVDRESGKIKVLRAVAVNDTGDMVNPDGVKNQIEGGVVQSLSWSLREAVRFDASGVKSDDWST